MSKAGQTKPAGQAGLDIVAGAFLAAVSLLALVWFIPNHVETGGQDFDLSPAFFPQLTAFSVLVLSLVLIGTRYRSWRAEPSSGPLLWILVETVFWLALAGLTLAGLNWMGFWPTSCLLILLLGVLGRHRNVLAIVALALAFPFLVDQVAWLIFTVELP